MFDIIIMGFILEHVDDPGRRRREASRDHRRVAESWSGRYPAHAGRAQRKNEPGTDPCTNRRKHPRDA